jgi:signal transduction histidine kinase
MKSIFFSSVAHELRTPLNSIIPIIKMIIMAYDNVLDDKIKKYLTIIHNSAIHLQNVIEDALDMSRLENNKFYLYLQDFNFIYAV